MKNFKMQSRNIIINAGFLSLFLPKGDCCSNQICILNRIVRRQGLSCNYPIENMNGLFPAVPIRETREHEPFRNMILTTK